MPLSQSLLQPPILANAGRLAIIAPNKAFVRELRRAAETPLPFRQKGVLFDIAPVYGNNDITVIGPLFGAPLAVACAECLIANGVRQILLCGSVGAFEASQRPLRIGDYLVPRGAISEDGTSRLYGGEELHSLAPDAGQIHFENVLRSHITSEVHEGIIWTTDAPYRETPEKVAAFTSRGAIAVEMEYAALLSLCKAHDISFSAAFFVSDIVGTEWRKGFAKLSDDATLTMLAKGILEVAREMSHDDQNK